VWCGGEIKMLNGEDEKDHSKVPIPLAAQSKPNKDAHLMHLSCVALFRTFVTDGTTVCPCAVEPKEKRCVLGLA
jgi:hypothetical protein